MYTNGRKLFPIKVKKRRGTLGGSKPLETPMRMTNLTHFMRNVSSVSDPVTLTDLVVILINIMYQHPKPSGGETAHTGVSQEDTVIASHNQYNVSPMSGHNERSHQTVCGTVSVSDMGVSVVPHADTSVFIRTGTRSKGSYSSSTELTYL